MKRFILMVTATIATLAATETTAASKEKPRGWLGVSVRDVTERIVERYSLKTDEGAYVEDVVDDSPADSAGIEEGDIIVEFSGQRIDDADDLSKAVRRSSPGTKTSVVVLREGASKSLQVSVGKYPRRTHAAGFHGAPKIRMFHRGGFLGMSVMTLSEQLAEYFGVPNKEGVLIDEVEKDSPADKAGLKAGDVVLRVGSRIIEDIDDLRKALSKYDEGEKAEIEVLRKGARKAVTLEVDEESDGPWGFVLPHIPDPPDIHFAPRFDHDFEFEFDLEPELRHLERKLERIGPMIEAKARKLKETTNREIPSAIRKQIV